MKQTKVLLAVFLTASAAMTSTGCGRQSKLVLDASLRTLTDGAKDYVQLQAFVDTGNLAVRGGEVQIPHPSAPGVAIGSVALYPTSQPRTSEVIVKLDLDETFYGLGADGYTLPNGAPLPLSGLNGAHPVAFQAGRHSRAYLALGPNVAVFGAALVIKEFDRLSSRMPYLNVFPEFNFGRVRGTAGIFTGAEAAQSGVAIFVDAGQVFNRGGSGGTVPTRALSFGTRSSDAEVNAVGMGLMQLNRARSSMSVR
jgi:hypothetical protein